MGRVSDFTTRPILTFHLRVYARYFVFDRALRGVACGFLYIWLSVSEVFASRPHPFFITLIKFDLHVVGFSAMFS